MGSNPTLSAISARSACVPALLRTGQGRTAEPYRQGRSHRRAFQYDIDEDAKRDGEVFDGKLLLVTNTAFAAPDVVYRYKSLADIERGFPVLKSDIDIAPVHHRLPERIRAHALICFLALIMHRVLRRRLRASGSTLSPTRALTLFRQVQQLHVTIDRTPALRTSQITAYQLDLFRQVKLTAPTACSAL